MEEANEMVKKVLLLDNASPTEIMKFKISQAIQKFKKSPRDTASGAIQGDL